MKIEPNYIDSVVHLPRVATRYKADESNYGGFCPRCFQTEEECSQKDCFESPILKETIHEAIRTQLELIKESLPEAYPTREGGTKEMPYTEYTTAQPAHKSVEMFIQMGHNSYRQTFLSNLKDKKIEL